jgi:hypothetical protein
MAGNPMRKPMPIRWIEEAEARQVLIAAVADAPAPRAAAPARSWLAAIRRWLADRPRLRDWRAQQLGQTVDPRQLPEFANDA